KDPVSLQMLADLAFRAMQKETRGGDRETVLKELTVTPIRSPACAVVTIATPVAKLPKASRNCRESSTANSRAASSNRVAILGTLIRLPLGGAAGGIPDRQQGYRIYVRTVRI